MPRENPNLIHSWISYMSNKVKTLGGINLAQGLPGFRPPEKLLALLAEEALANNHQYAPGRGIPSLTAHVARYLGLSPEQGQSNVLITCGATEAITVTYLHLSRQVGARFTVAAFGPAYESYTRLPSLLGHRFIELQRDPLDKDYLAKAAAILATEGVNLLIVGSPGNPHGHLITPEETAFWCQLAATTQLHVLFDMVYSELWQSQPPSFPLPVLQDRVYVVGSFSKMFSITGWRIGWLAGQTEPLNHIGLLHDFTGLSAPHPLQWAISRFLDLPDAADDYIRHIRRLIGESRQALEATLCSCGFEVLPAGGGYFVWAKLPDAMPDSGQFVLDQYDAVSVAAVPGVHFGARFDRFVRFNGARPIGEIKEASARIIRFIEERN